MAKAISRAIVGALTDTSTTQQNALGMVAMDEAGNEYTYVKAGAAIAQYDAVMFNGSAAGYDDVRKVAAAAQQLCLGAAQVAIASASYGWVLSKGVGTVKIANSTAVGSLLVTGTGAAGTLQLAVATDLVSRGIEALTTGGSSSTAGAVAYFA